MKEISNYTPNKEVVDDLGRVSGIFLVDKPVNLTSHDIVDQYRKKFNTRKVGHAGALDPFATGLLVILVGKALKLSESFLNLSKEYIAEILIGVSTDSFDIEGKVLDYIKTDLVSSDSNLTEENIKKELASFKGENNQYVPVFSSVKVNGNKLRELARSYDSFEIIESNNKRVVKFKRTRNSKEEILEVDLPIKRINIYEIDVLESFDIKYIDLKNSYTNLKGVVDQLDKIEDINNRSEISFKIVKIKVKCSKGTYIRQLAYDIGIRLGYPAMLVNLRRTGVGDYSI